MQPQTNGLRTGRKTSFAPFCRLWSFYELIAESSLNPVSFNYVFTYEMQGKYKTLPGDEKKFTTFYDICGIPKTCIMKYLSLFVLLILSLSCLQKNLSSVKSPDGKTEVSFSIDENGELKYTVKHLDEIIIAPSTLGFTTDEHSPLGKNVEITSVKVKTNDNTWKPTYGERSEIRDNYKEATVFFTETIEPQRQFEITFRAYNEGIAFKTSFLPVEGVDSLNILSEDTEFNFTEDYNSWVSDRAQSEYRKQSINKIERPAERPLVVEAGNNFVALGEAKLVDFARMKFLSGEKDNSLKAQLHGSPQVALPYTTPWRTIMIGKSAGELLQNNFLFENLNDECAIADVSWIKPGKVIREVTLTTQGGYACVDFAAQNGLQFIEFDAGWYGNEYDDASDATTITVDPKRSPGPLELLEVIEYAKSKGIGVILYVNRRALEKQLDEVLPLLEEWGVAGVKYGFVNVGSQKWTKWLHEAVIKAADHKLMIDIHDEYRPTGFSRTYPNLMTQEGIRGDEESPSNEHTLITLFTRMLAGAGDNTNCYYAPRVQEKMGGNVSQLAKAVMIYSPWQFLYWYDRPQGSPGKKGGAGGNEGFIMNHPELEFFKQMPAVWDESKVIDGKIGEYATIARKSGESWFLGSLTAKEPRKLNFKSDFLEPNKSFKATVYSYDANSESSTKVEIEAMDVTAGSDLSFNIAGNSGLAIHFAPIK